MFLGKNEPGAGSDMSKIRTPEKNAVEPKQVCAFFILHFLYVILAIPHNVCTVTKDNKKIRI